jgi:hypothetical protein
MSTPPPRRRRPAFRPDALGYLEPRCLLTAVTSFSLINASTDQVIAGYESIDEGETIVLANLPTTSLNVRANIDGVNVASVKFGYDANANFRVESAAPYALFGDSSGNYHVGSLAVGSHTLTGTAYTGTGATGTAGTPLVRHFSVVQDPPPPPSSPGWPRPSPRACRSTSRPGPIASC